MPQYYSPGVYIEEVDTGPQPIEGVATAVAAFIGFAPYSTHADANRPVLITSWSQYVERFGLPDLYGRRKPHMKDAYLSHAVYGFFQNGGSRCYVVRVVRNEEQEFFRLPPRSIEIPAQKRNGEQIKALAVTPKPTSIASDIDVSFGPEPGAAPGSGKFKVVVRTRKGDELVEEPFSVELPPAPKPGSKAAAASKNTAAKGGGKGDGDGGDQSGPPPGPSSNGDSSGAPASDLLGGKSAWITLTELRPTDEELKQRLPEFETYKIAVPQPAGNELAMVGTQTVIGDVTERSGVEGLEIAEEVTMVCCPDLMSPIFHKGKALETIGADPEADELIRAVQSAMIAHAERAGDRIAILDAPPDQSPQAIADWRTNRAKYDSMYAALYYPWISVANPLAAESGQPQTIPVPPCGHIAGVFARNDSTRGVHKAPANEVIRGALAPVYGMTRGDQDGLNPVGVNCIRTFPGRSAVVWGARTLSSSKPAWRYINVRRLFNYVEKSIERGTQWVVFEPNDAGLWSRVRRDVGAFLLTLWRDGMLLGATPQQAFYVKCDEELNPKESRDQGRLIIEVGMAPVKPAEFVIFRFSQWAGDGS